MPPKLKYTCIHENTRGEHNIPTCGAGVRPCICSSEQTREKRYFKASSNIDASIRSYAKSLDAVSERKVSSILALLNNKNVSSSKLERAVLELYSLHHSGGGPTHKMRAKEYADLITTRKDIAEHILRSLPEYPTADLVPSEEYS